MLIRMQSRGTRRYRVQVQLQMQITGTEPGCWTYGMEVRPSPQGDLHVCRAWGPVLCAAVLVMPCNALCPAQGRCLTIGLLLQFFCQQAPSRPRCRPG